MKKTGKFFIMGIAVFLSVMALFLYNDSKTGYEIENHKIEISEAIFKIEGGNTETLVKYPVICPESEEANEKINKHIFDTVIFGDLVEYQKYPNQTEISYEITSINEQVLDIYFHGSGYYVGSPLFFDKGMLFDLETGEILSLKFFYELKDMRNIISNAREKNEIQVDLGVGKEWKEEIIIDFLKLFETDEYISQKDNYFIKDDNVYFIAPAPESMRGYIFIKIGIYNFPKIVDKCCF